MNAGSNTALAAEEERGAQRQTLIWKGVLHHDHQSTQVRVRNISATGAMVESPTQVRVGAQPVLELSDTISIPVTVEWTAGEHLGVSFHDPFELSLLAQTRPIGVQPTWAPPVYLDSAVQAAWERRLRRLRRLSPAQLRDELKEYFRD
jgi:hypothetical protein